MRKNVWILFLLALSLFESHPVSAVQAENIKNHIFKVLPSELKWANDPSLPKDIQVAVLYGDPSKEGLLIMRIKAPAGSKIAPHWHPTDENVTVLSGSFNLGRGDKFDTKHGESLPVSGFTSIPAHHRHFAWFTEDTILQVDFYGKWAINYVNPSDDPRHR